MAGGDSFWVPFRYEKLPLTCHYCGIVGHDDRACIVKYNEEKAGVQKSNQYGAWMKASPIKNHNRRRSESSSAAEQSSGSSGKGSWSRSENQGSDNPNLLGYGRFENSLAHNQRENSKGDLEDTDSASEKVRFGPGPGPNKRGGSIHNPAESWVEPTLVLVDVPIGLEDQIRPKVGSGLGLDVETGSNSGKAMDVDEAEIFSHEPTKDNLTQSTPITQIDEEKMARREMIYNGDIDERDSRWFHGLKSMKAVMIQKEAEEAARAGNRTRRMGARKGKTIRGSKTKSRTPSQPKRSMEKGNSVQAGKEAGTKRKGELSIMEGDVVDEENLPHSKKQKQIQGESNKANKEPVEEASREWPHGVK